MAVAFGGGGGGGGRREDKRPPPFYRERMLRIATPGAPDTYLFLILVHDAVIRALDSDEPDKVPMLDSHMLWRLNHCLLTKIVERARTPDEYEPNPEHVYSIGGDATRLVWLRGLEWSIEDFFSMMIAADNVLVARENQWLAEAKGDDQGQRILWELSQLPPDQRYPELLLADPCLSSSPWRRLEVKCMLIWISLALDERIERLFCKRNETLEEMDLDVPAENEILAMRVILPQALTSYVRGLCTRRQFLDYLIAAYETGRQTLPPLHPPSAEGTTTTTKTPTVAAAALFNPDQSIIAHMALPTHLVFVTAAAADPMDIDRPHQERRRDGGEEEEEDVRRYPSGVD
jgi:hypothetical protein